MQQIGVLCSVFARAPAARGREVICNMRRKIGSLRWHFPHDPARNVELVEELAEELVAMDGHKAAGGAAMQEAGQVGRAASRTRALAWKDLASTTAMADGPRLAKDWHDLWMVGRACQIDFGGVQQCSRRTISISGRFARRLWFVQRPHCYWFRQIAPSSALETRL